MALLPIVMTVGADVSLDFPRTQGPDGRSALYEAGRADGSRWYTLKIAHTVPSVPNGRESHLIRLYAQDFDLEGKATRLHSVHTVIQTTGGAQDPTTLRDMWAGLNGSLSAGSDNRWNALLGREV